MTLREVADDLCSTQRKGFFDGSPILIHIPARVTQYICRPINRIARPLSTDSWITQAVDLKLGGFETWLIPFKANVSASLVTHVQVTTPKSTADHGVIARTVLFS